MRLNAPQCRSVTGVGVVEAAGRVGGFCYFDDMLVCGENCETLNDVVVDAAACQATSTPCIGASIPPAEGP